MGCSVTAGVCMEDHHAESQNEPITATGLLCLSREQIAHTERQVSYGQNQGRVSSSSCGLIDSYYIHDVKFESLNFCNTFCNDLFIYCINTGGLITLKVNEPDLF